MGNIGRVSCLSRKYLGISIIIEKLKCQHIARKDLFQMEVEEEIENIESNLKLWTIICFGMTCRENIKAFIHSYSNL